MDTGTLAVLLAALLGAVVGGIASALGSAWISRAEHRRRVRLRLYDELIPAAIDGLEQALGAGLPGISSEIEDQVDAVLRAADVAGRKDSKHLDAVRQGDIELSYLEQRAAYIHDEHGQQVPIEQDAEEAHALVGQLAEGLSAYQRWLRRKLLGPLPPRQ